MVKRVPSQLPFTDHQPDLGMTAMDVDGQQEQGMAGKRARYDSSEALSGIRANPTLRPGAQLRNLEQSIEGGALPNSTLGQGVRVAGVETEYREDSGTQESAWVSAGGPAQLSGGAANGAGGNLALQNYQMELRLHELKHKDRLRAAKAKDIEDHRERREEVARLRSGPSCQYCYVRKLKCSGGGVRVEDDSQPSSSPQDSHVANGRRTACTNCVRFSQACELGHSFKPPRPKGGDGRSHATSYAVPFCNFMTDNPTVFHAVDDIKAQLKKAGFEELSERDSWNLKPSGAYYVDRNGSSLIAFTVGTKYKPGNGAAILAGHIDAITAKLKPVSKLPHKAGYLQVAVAPYASGLNKTWWDRDLGIGGRVLVRGKDGKINTKLVKLDWPIARIPTLAEHFGTPAQGPFNLETQMVPIFGLAESEEDWGEDNFSRSFDPSSSELSSFAMTQPHALVNTISGHLDIDPADIVNWELELFDVQPATLGGLNKDFIFAGRIDDKLCSWAAVQALLEDKASGDESSLLKVVGLFDDEEIGSLLRQGARSNFLPSVIERAVGALSENHALSSDVVPRTYANSFMISSDVIHAVNPNFLNAYLENHSPSLNVGVVVSADSNGHMTTDAVSTAILQSCAKKCDSKLQVFQIRNDSRSGGTVGPMLSSATGIRAVDAGIPQLSMHSIRATTGSKDPGLGVKLFKGFLKHFEQVDKEFR